MNAYVRASGYVGVFRSGDLEDLTVKLQRIVSSGCLPAGERLALSEWAQCLGADAGARYLLDILDHAEGMQSRPMTPWGVF